MWWWFWLAFVCFFLLLPLGYGWGDRDWGPPYPTSITRRRPPGGKILEERVDDDGPVAGRWPRPAWGGAATGTSARVPSTEEPT